MRKLMNWLAVAAITLTLPAGCGNDDEPNGGELGAPTATMVGADIDAVHEITPDMIVKVDIKAPAGIKGFEIDIDSKPLKDLLPLVGLAEHLDLVNPGDMAEPLKGLKFPVKDEVAGKTELTLDISTLIPLIGQIDKTTGDHKFTLTLTDAKLRKLVKVLTFHTTTPVVYNDDADLWKNTATVTVANLPAGAKVQYRVKGTAAWADATLVAETTNKYELAPVWEAKKNAAQLDVYAVKSGTGVFAATTYECGIVEGSIPVETIEFTTAVGDVVPNGNMSGWSQKDMADAGDNIYKITYPNAAGQTFWDSGNNLFLENPQSLPYTPLCEQDKTEAGTANLSARMVLGFVFAPGNMFTGDFIYSGMSGSADFGKAYAWTARPRALKIRYKATVGTIDKVGASDPDAADYDGKADRSRIYVAVVDWTKQHSVVSGMVEPTGMWDPATAKSVEEGNILGYGDLVITESKGEWTEVQLPIDWYAQNAAKPASGKISLVISCATSFRGDYLTGCSTNVMNVDDFQWVY